MTAAERICWTAQVDGRWYAFCRDHGRLKPGSVWRSEAEKVRVVHRRQCHPRTTPYRPPEPGDKWAP